MKKIIYSLYIALPLFFLAPGAAAAQSGSESGYEVHLGDRIAEPYRIQSERAPQVEVRDGMIVPLCPCESLQVFNVMGQEVANEHLPAGIYLVRLVTEGQTYTIKVVIR